MTKTKIACEWCGLFSKLGPVCEICGSPLPDASAPPQPAQEDSQRRTKRAASSVSGTGLVQCSWCGGVTKPGPVCAECGSPMGTGYMIPAPPEVSPVARRPSRTPRPSPERTEPHRVPKSRKASPPAVKKPPRRDAPPRRRVVEEPPAAGEEVRAAAQIEVAPPPAVEPEPEPVHAPPAAPLLVAPAEPGWMPKGPPRLHQWDHPTEPTWMPPGVETELFPPRPAPVEELPEAEPFEPQLDPPFAEPLEVEPLEPEPEPEPEPVAEPVAEPVEEQVVADTFALDADEVTPKWMMCSRCGQPSAQPLCEACQEAYKLLRALSQPDEET